MYIHVKVKVNVNVEVNIHVHVHVQTGPDLCSSVWGQDFDMVAVVEYPDPEPAGAWQRLAGYLSHI